MFGPALEEELTTLFRYTSHASVALALGRAGHWGALWSNQHRAKKKRLEGSICDLKIQRDKYLEEIKKASTSLTGLKDVLLSLNLFSSLSY